MTADSDLKTTALSVEEFKDLPLYKLITEVINGNADPNDVGVSLSKDPIKSSLNSYYNETSGSETYPYTFLHYTYAHYKTAMYARNEQDDGTKIVKLLSVIAYLIEAGIDPNVRVRPSGDPFLHEAINLYSFYPNDLVITLLNSKKIDVNLVDNIQKKSSHNSYKNTPLHLVISYNRADYKQVEPIVTRLLEREEIDVNAVNSDGHSALALLAMHSDLSVDSIDLMTSLLNKGANPNIVFNSYNGKQTLLMWAMMEASHKSCSSKIGIKLREFVNQLLLNDRLDVNLSAGNTAKDSFNTALDYMENSNFFMNYFPDSSDIEKKIKVLKFSIKLIDKGAIPSQDPSSPSVQYFTALAEDGDLLTLLDENPQLKKTIFQNGLQQYMHEADRWYKKMWMHVKAFFGFGLTLEKFNLTKEALENLKQVASGTVSASSPVAEDSLAHAIFSNNVPEILKRFDQAHNAAIIQQKDPAHKANPQESSLVKDANNLPKLNSYKGRLKKLTNCD